MKKSKINKNEKSLEKGKNQKNQQNEKSLEKGKRKKSAKIQSHWKLIK